jgi:hypothetical protein
MSSNNSTQKKEILHRVNTRIFASQDAFIKAEAKKSKGQLSEGDVHRALLEEAITNRKNS